MARACGCDTVVEVAARDTAQALTDALASRRMTVIVAKCDSGNIKVPVITKDPVVIRDRFMTAVQS